MTGEEFEGLLARGRELRNTEYKGPGPRTSAMLVGKVMRAMFGMANLQDGGIVFIGVDEQSKVLVRTGMSEHDMKTWTHDDLAAKLENYADPAIEFDIEQFEHEGKHYVAIRVHEFEDLPILCKKEYKAPDGKGSSEQIMRQGACYVRPRHKPETSDIPTQAEMRDLLDLATRKAVRRFIRQADAAGISVGGTTQLSDTGRFAAQVRQMSEA